MVTVRIPLNKFNENQNYIGEGDGSIDIIKHSLKQLANIAVAGVHDRRISADEQYMEFSNISKYNVFNREAVLAILSQEGQIENYPMWLSLTTTQLSQSIPNGIPGKTYINETEEQVVLSTWNDWISYHNKNILDLSNGNKAISLSDGVKYFDGSVYLICVQSGLTILDTNEVKALLPTPSDIL